MDKTLFAILLGGVLLGVIEIFAKAYISTQFSDAVVFSVLCLKLTAAHGSYRRVKM